MDDQIEIMKNQLYDACREQLGNDDDKLYEKIFGQDDLMALDVAPPSNVKILMKVIQQLTAEWLFAPVNTGHGIGWRLRTEVEAAKFNGLTKDQVMVYTLIDASGADGIWQQEIKKKTMMQDPTVRKVLKELEGKRLVTSFNSVENITKRRWIKTSIKPSVKATGGPWYTDGELDESFIETLLLFLFNVIKESGSYYSVSGGGSGTRSTTTSPVLPKKVIRGSASDVADRGKKRTADAMVDDDPFSSPVAPTHAAPPKSRKVGGSHPVRLFLPSGYMNYMTLQDLTTKLSETGLTKGTKLKDSDVKQLLDVLVFDGRIEEVKIGKRRGYRAARVSKHDPHSNMDLNAEDVWGKPPTNGLTTAPCGRCPVFELCEEGGPVWAGGCEYFDRWFS